MKPLRSILCLIMGVGLACAAHALGDAPDTLAEIRASHARVRDMVVHVVRKEVREAELRRMKRSATSVLEFSRIKLYFMAPDRLRLEGRRGLVPVTLVENGNTKVIRFGLGIKSRSDLTGEPGKKQSGLDFGLLSGQVWQDYHVSVVGTETFEHRPAVVLLLKARAGQSGSYHKVWVDAENYRMLRRDRFAGDGQLKHRHVFQDPYRSPAGTWLSRRIEVYNQYGKYVGALELSDIEVNQGLAESLFRT